MTPSKQTPPAMVLGDCGAALPRENQDRGLDGAALSLSEAASWALVVRVFLLLEGVHLS